MEDALGVYARPYDPGRPFVCLDETNQQPNWELPRRSSDFLERWSCRSVAARR
ncbi:MAG: hypothetical protein OXN89_25135 [Bryobacterales bacterium]|nr:hypothetical protein [Bryobacterales bacterium]